MYVTWLYYIVNYVYIIHSSMVLYFIVDMLEEEGDMLQHIINDMWKVVTCSSFNIYTTAHYIYIYII